MKKFIMVICIVSVIISILTISVFADNEPTSMKDILQDILGQYTPEVVQVQETDANNNTTIKEEVKPDYVWLVGALFVLVFIYCLFRLGGVLIG